MVPYPTYCMYVLQPTAYVRLSCKVCCPLTSFYIESMVPYHTIVTWNRTTRGLHMFLYVNVQVQTNRHTYVWFSRLSLTRGDF
jgi:hypothetical protein